MNAEPVEGEPLLSRSKTTIGIFNRFNINQSSTFKGINGLCEGKEMYRQICRNLAYYVCSNENGF